MNPILSLVLIAVIPVCISVLLHAFYKSQRGSKLSKKTQDIMTGIIFGLIAICGTEFGVPLNGAVMNARDAAPLCAGLIFSPLSGIIAGLMGGIERWFAVYWGAGYYTRLACSISTCLTGFIAAILKKEMFDGEIPGWPHAFIIGVICETIHMIMIFVTNMNDVKTAFGFVEACTIPMVSVNALAVGVAVLAVSLYDYSTNKGETAEKPSIAMQVQRNLVIVIIIGFIATASFGLLLQNQISIRETEDLLRLNIEDAVGDVNTQVDEALLQVNELVVEELKDNPAYNLRTLCGHYNIAEIDVIDGNGIITESSDDLNIGFDMNSGDQAREFLVLLGDTENYVQDYGPISRDSNVYRKYSGVKYKDGFVQVAYDSKEFFDEMAVKLNNVATYRHIGETGNLVIIDDEGKIVSYSDGMNGTKISSFRMSSDLEDSKEYTVFVANVDGVESYCMYKKAQGFAILGILPCNEADFSKKISTYLNIFMEMLVFGMLLVAIYFLMKMLVVSDIRRVNGLLARITGGDLDTVVNVRTNKEFISLSNGINTTVDKLKDLIAEANERIDSELRYAKEIQSSALPSVFPAFPDRNEFDIYALMVPAREVGGDFYDFYLIDKDMLVFTVADVSGKGIPAALFMMRSKTILKTYAENNISVADIFTNANYNLCEGNDAGMFLTAWMGFLDLKTGELKYANAGHNRPLLRRKDGSFEFLSGPPGFILGGMEGIVYKEQSLMLEPGDEIFLYTDGVVEATDANKDLYGDDRLVECINAHKDEDVMQMCQSIYDDIEIFYNGAPQFDDITEMAVKFMRYKQ